VAEETLVIFSSDNGPWAGYGDHAGKTPYREAKATSFDGGVRSATIMRYPGRIKAGAVSEAAMATIDLLPTIAKLCGAPLPENEIDGADVWPLIIGEKGAESPHKYYPFSTGRKLESVISGDGRWKLHLPHRFRHVVEVGTGGLDARKYSHPEIGLSLFDMKSDPFETQNVIGRHPEVAERLKGWADAHARRFYGKE
jgi:arylsulfatase A